MDVAERRWRDLGIEVAFTLSFPKSNTCAALKRLREVCAHSVYYVLEITPFFSKYPTEKGKEGAVLHSQYLIWSHLTVKPSCYKKMGEV